MTEELEKEPAIIHIYYDDGSSESYGRSNFQWDLSDDITIVLRAEDEEIYIPWIKVKKIVVKNGLKTSDIQNSRKITNMLI
jgi:hypothetical protein